jgi:hypothetical protein
MCMVTNNKFKLAESKKERKKHIEVLDACFLFLIKECETGVSRCSYMYASVGCLFFLCICICLMHTGNYHHDDICRNVTSVLVYVCMYAIDNRFELQERKKKKGRFGISFFRSSSIWIDNHFS